MINMNFEFFLGNLCFVLLFLIMIFYWIEALFSIIPKFNVLLFFSTITVNLSLFTILIYRWLYYGYFPLSNLYESLLFLSWSFTVIQLFFLFPLLKFNFNIFFNNLYFYFPVLKFLNNKNKLLKWNKIPFFSNTNFFSSAVSLRNKVAKTKTQFVKLNVLIGIIFSPITLFTHSFAIFSLPKTLQKAQALVPALQSNWLMMHVTVMMLSYTALLCGSLLSITFLVITWYQSKFNSNTSFLNQSINHSPELTSNLYSPEIALFENSSNKKNLNMNFQKSSAALLRSTSQKANSKKTNTQLMQTLDNLSYRIIGIGFPLLTIGILSGAVWANEAWGSYWSWDPKETWAFITWLIFAIYLHTRITQGWAGKKSAILASVGFFVVWICYLGVNLVGKGLHSYGWIQFS